jgi:hypothetical protein
MRIIEVRPTKKFGGGWVSFEAPGVESAFEDKTRALSYAMARFGGSAGEIHIYDDAGENIILKIPVDDRTQYGQSAP